ncbi:Geminivirus AL1 replication-associated protein, catalytic domain protein, partial [Metarhizium majus ARSEF 297]
MEADVVFVTYTRSRVEDKQRFYEYLLDSLERSLSRIRATQRVSVKVFGAKELHEDGTPHYHVLIQFSQTVLWTKARDRLAVWIMEDGRPVVDTHSIYIKKKKAEESREKFVWAVQTYVGKHGDVFGEKVMR